MTSISSQSSFRVSFRPEALDLINLVVFMHHFDLEPLINLEFLYSQQYKSLISHNLFVVNSNLPCKIIRLEGFQSCQWVRGLQLGVLRYYQLEEKSTVEGPRWQRSQTLSVLISKMNIIWSLHFMYCITFQHIFFFIRHTKSQVFTQF